MFVSQMFYVWRGKKFMGFKMYGMPHGLPNSKLKNDVYFLNM